jgi:hypothetical protein
MGGLEDGRRGLDGQAGRSSPSASPVDKDNAIKLASRSAH